MLDCTEFIGLKAPHRRQEVQDWFPWAHTEPEYQHPLELQTSRLWDRGGALPDSDPVDGTTEILDRVMERRSRSAISTRARLDDLLLQRQCLMGHETHLLKGNIRELLQQREAELASIHLNPLIPEREATGRLDSQFQKLLAGLPELEQRKWLASTRVHWTERQLPPCSDQLLEVYLVQDDLDDRWHLVGFDGRQFRSHAGFGPDRTANVRRWRNLSRSLNKALGQPNARDAAPSTALAERFRHKELAAVRAGIASLKNEIKAAWIKLDTEHEVAAEQARQRRELERLEEQRQYLQAGARAEKERALQAYLKQAKAEAWHYKDHEPKPPAAPTLTDQDWTWADSSGNTVEEVGSMLAEKIIRLRARTKPAAPPAYHRRPSEATKLGSVTSHG